MRGIRRDGGAVSSGGTDEARPIITALTGIRALAAAAVVLYHLRESVLVPLVPALRVLDPWLRYGFLGVDVFFVLSGFIISYTYAERFARVDRHEYVSYLRARFARIYPVHLVTLFMTAGFVGFCAVQGLISQWTRLHTPGDFVGNLFLLQALPGVHAWNTPSWSVSCEFAAYLVFPLFAGLLLRLRRPLAAALALAVPVLLVVAVDAVSTRAEFSTAALFWIRITAEFTLGCLLWAVWRHGVRRRPLWDLVGVGALAGAGLILRLENGGPNAWFAVGLLALFVMAAASASGPLRRLLASRPLEYGGRISYSVYLAQAPATGLAIVLMPPRLYADAPLAVRLVILGGIVVVPFLAGALLYRVVEEPARTWLRGRRPPPASSDAVEAVTASTPAPSR